MDLGIIIGGLIAQYPMVGLGVFILGALVVLGQVYIALTPSKNDDAWYAKVEATPVVGHLLKVLASFAPIQRKQ